MDCGLSKEIDPLDPRQELCRQQRESRGFDDTELWNLDTTFVAFMLPRLRIFRGQYRECTDEPERLAAIDKIISEFERVNENYPYSRKDEEFDKALKLFAENVRGFWL